MSASRQKFFGFGNRRSVVKGKEEDTTFRVRGFGQLKAPIKSSGIVKSRGGHGDFYVRTSGFGRGSEEAFSGEANACPSQSAINEGEAAIPEGKSKESRQLVAEREVETELEPEKFPTSREAENGNESPTSEELKGLDTLRAQRVVVKLRKEIFGMNHRSTIDAMNKHAMLLKESGKWAEAVLVMDEVREARRGREMNRWSYEEFKRGLGDDVEFGKSERRHKELREGGVNGRTKLRGRRVGGTNLPLRFSTRPSPLGSATSIQRYGRQLWSIQTTSRQITTLVPRRFRRPFVLGRRRGVVRGAENGEALASRFGSARWSHVHAAFIRREEQYRTRLMCGDITTTEPAQLGIAPGRGKETERELRTPYDYKPCALVEFFKQGRAGKDRREDSDTENTASNTEQGISLSTPAGSMRAGSHSPRRTDDSNRQGEEDVHEHAMDFVSDTSVISVENKEYRRTILIIEDTHQRGSARSRGQETKRPLRSGREVVEFFSGGCNLDGEDAHSIEPSDGIDASKTTSLPIRPTWWGNIRGTTRSREGESLDVRSMGFGRRSNTSVADPHAALHPTALVSKASAESRGESNDQMVPSKFGLDEISTAEAYNDPGTAHFERAKPQPVIQNDEESLLAKASRLARAETEPKHASLDIRRRDIVSFRPFRGVAESKDVPVYERPGVKRGTVKEEYERWKAKEEEEQKARKKEVELKAKSRYASSLKPRRAAWRDEKEPGFAGRAGVATSGGSERVIIPTMQSHDDKNEKEYEYGRWDVKKDDEEARKKEAELKAKSRYASSFKSRRAAWGDTKNSDFARRTDIPASGGDSKSVQQSDTTTCYSTDTQAHISLRQLEDRFEALKASSGLPQEMSWDQLIEALNPRKDTESFLSHMNDSNKAGGVTGGGTSWYKLLAVIQIAVQPGPRSTTQEDVFTSIKFELGLPKEMTWDEFAWLELVAQQRVENLLLINGKALRKVLTGMIMEDGFSTSKTIYQ